MYQWQDDIIRKAVIEHWMISGCWYVEWRQHIQILSWHPRSEDSATIQNGSRASERPCSWHIIELRSFAIGSVVNGTHIVLREMSLWAFSSPWTIVDELSVNAWYTFLLSRELAWSCNNLYVYLIAVVIMAIAWHLGQDECLINVVISAIIWYDIMTEKLRKTPTTMRKAYYWQNEYPLLSCSAEAFLKAMHSTLIYSVY